jgi:hypothetical protein
MHTAMATGLLLQTPNEPTSFNKANTGEVAQSCNFYELKDENQNDQ